jgi:hypothetical protein
MDRIGHNADTGGVDMARNRMIKPEFWASETLMRVSRDSRLLFIGLWNFCDDYGFCMNSNRKILGDVFPIDESVSETNIKKWINELIAINVVIPIEYKGKKLLFIKSWGEHQTVQHKSKRSFIESDDLEQVIKDALDSHETLMRSYLDSHAPKRKKKEKEESNKGFKAWSREDFWNDIIKACDGKEYAQGMIEEFFRWWSEPDANNKMKFQLKETWSTAGRLVTWSNKTFN